LTALRNRLRRWWDDQMLIGWAGLLGTLLGIAWCAAISAGFIAGIVNFISQ